ncbi:acyl carrier protein [Dactylosporangium sp. NPDC050688]|uniref:acyl carrier protein n=1 Tax=Dactylosporangium sp. NPDC050688 TaxID=3157217 RepID=UPI0033F61CD5
MPGQELVIEIAEAVFGQRVAMDDNLFDLGVDSIQIAEYCDRLERALGRRIDMVALMNADSFGSFSRTVMTADR